MSIDINALAQTEINDALAQLKQLSEYPTPSTQYARVLRKYITSLVEALEKAQRWERRWHQVATRVHEQACDSDVKIEELEQLLSDGVTEEALVLRERIAELESRTVTVKLPSLKQTESCERYVWSDGVFNYRSDVIGILRAAGIQVIEGEGQ